MNTETNEMVMKVGTHTNATTSAQHPQNNAIQYTIETRDKEEFEF